MRIFKTEQVDAKKTIEDTLAHVQIGAETTFANMTIFPLLDGDSGPTDYLTLDDALARGHVQITEVSVEGSVPDLKLKNESDEPVLLLDGEELIGAKQNRILNLTILAPANRTIVIPVSCVESGRWSRRSANFTTSSQAHFARGRAKKMAQVSHSLRASGERRSDQHAVWEEIGTKANDLKVSSPTSAMIDIYESYTGRIDEYAGAFTAADRQVGAAFAISGEVIGFDLFDSPATFKKLLPKLVRSYALDAIESAEKKSASTPSAVSVKDLLLSVTKAEAKTFPAVGEGMDVRFTAPNVTAAGLVAKGRVVHLSGFRLQSVQGHSG
jgi:ARG and Rhodanese-Phosphatase-superfamily-associated Protein domain